MCGIVGVAGDINKKEKDAFKFLLHLDIFRGPHSTGMATVAGNGTWDVVKKKGTAWDLFDSSEFTTTFNKPSFCMIGHNRYATKGKVNAVNAHPFEFEDVVGVHNGTIRQQHYLPDHTRFEVDSENIFYSIQQDGLEETLGKLAGAYALVYWDKRTEELTLLRNDERELFFVYSEDGNTIFWASEEWMLHVALSKHNIKYGTVLQVLPERIYRFSISRKFKPDHPVELNTEPFEEFVPKTTYFRGQNGGTTYGGGTNQSSNNKAVVPAGKTQPLKGKESPFRLDPSVLNNRFADFTVDGPSQKGASVEYLSGRLLADDNIEVRLYMDNKSREWQDILAVCSDVVFKAKMTFCNAQTQPHLIANARTVEEVIDDEDDDGEEAYEDTFLGYNNRLLTRTEYERRTANGCAFCSDPITTTQSKEVLWVSFDTVYCPSCAKNPDALELMEAWDDVR